MTAPRKKFDALIAAALLPGFVFPILLLLCAAPLAAQDQSLCNVRGIMGTVKVLTARDRNANPSDVSTWPDARLNMALRERDIIATLPESEVRLETLDGSTVRLRENTRLEVAALKGGLNATTTRLRLADGSIVADVKKVAGSRSTFELETPTSLAAIRGTTVELNSRNSGTTLKTFDGNVDVTPRRGRRAASVGNYQMTEIAPGQQSASVRGVPSFYRPRTTTLLSEEETAALTGFTRVILTYSELEEIKRMLESDGIPASIGIAESDDEMTARTISSDAARTELATAMSTQVQRISESYVQNINGEAKRMWEEGVRQLTDVNVRGSSVHTTITQMNPQTGRFRVYSLMVLQPERMKNALVNTTDRLEEEFQLRARKDDMMSSMDAAIHAYSTRYHDR
ncbi:MAG: FecR family protein [Chitinispirillales bacterium]|jgi:hypothetical protein|nr:FecR family protein [Chitinispirillales bacterium]